VSGRKIKEKKTQGKSTRKKGKICNGFSLNPHDINRRRLDHKIQDEFNFCGNRTNKKTEKKRNERIGRKGAKLLTL
jgi:hypothetical protein